jgi:hypothetical protein
VVAARAAGRITDAEIAELRALGEEMTHQRAGRLGTFASPSHHPIGLPSGR